MDTSKYIPNEIEAIGFALDSDISAIKSEKMVDGIVQKVFLGTVYEAIVVTPGGLEFHTFEAAKNNARRFVTYCKDHSEKIKKQKMYVENMKEKLSIHKNTEFDKNASNALVKMLGKLK